MARCEKTGKARTRGNNVSHSHRKTKRDFGANLQRIRIVDENGQVRRAVVSTKALRSGLVQKAAPRRVLREMEEQDSGNS